MKNKVIKIKPIITNPYINNFQKIKKKKLTTTFILHYTIDYKLHKINYVRVLIFYRYNRFYRIFK